MKKPTERPCPDTSGPRILLAPPISYQPALIRELRTLPVRENPRLQVLSYELTSAPGMIGKPRTHGHGAVRLSGGFILALCVTLDAGEWCLEVQPNPFDEVLDWRASLECSPQLLADIYRAVQQRQIAAQGRAYGRAEGRN